MSEQPFDLDKHRGMAAQKATDLRRTLAEVETHAKELCAIDRPRSKTSFPSSADLAGSRGQGQIRIESLRRRPVAGGQPPSQCRRGYL
jgi:hypothetical protein